jgi:hypothetical protein
MTEATARTLARFAYSLLPPHIQLVAAPFYDIAVALIASGLESLQLEVLLEDLWRNREQAIDALVNR